MFNWRDEEIPLMIPKPEEIFSFHINWTNILSSHSRIMGGRIVRGDWSYITLCPDSIQ